jgi:flagellar motor protein MotB
MRVWLDPWPAVSDLFSGLLVAVFSTLILFTGFQWMGKQREDRARTEVDNLRKAVAAELEKTLGQKARPCGIDDLCIDLQIEFATDKDDVVEPHKTKLQNACEALKNAANSLTSAQRSEIEIQIEGHTDSRIPQNALAARDKYLYNWHLSSNRASSVLYEFDQCGLRDTGMRVIALGFAGTRPAQENCQGDADRDCLQRNRRTTFRIRPDTIEIKKRIGAG